MMLVSLRKMLAFGLVACTLAVGNSALAASLSKADKDRYFARFMKTCLSVQRVKSPGVPHEVLNLYCGCVGRRTIEALPKVLSQEELLDIAVAGKERASQSPKIQALANTHGKACLAELTQ